MLRLFALVVIVLGLASLLPSAPSAAALPADTPNQPCLGPLRSSLVRSGSTLTTRDPETGEIVVIGGDSNPGDFHGAAGLVEFAALFPRFVQEGCQLPIFQPGDCIDFSSDTQCGSADTDGDDYLDFLEVATGSDPNSPQSTPEYALLDEQTGSRTCSDRSDNDLDGRIDNGDAGCRLTCDDFGGKDRCSDKDHDGWRKYVEEMYGSDPDNRLSTPEWFAVAGTCGDSVDNDLDGEIDAADSGCGGIADCIDFDDTPDCAPF